MKKLEKWKNSSGPSTRHTKFLFFFVKIPPAAHRQKSNKSECVGWTARGGEGSIELKVMIEIIINY